jgi:hypothetical protein
MQTINTILKELKNVPVNRLEELYQVVHSFTSVPRQPEKFQRKILSYAGAFSDMSIEDYSDYLNQTIKTRNGLFNRKIEL